MTLTLHDLIDILFEMAVEDALPLSPQSIRTFHDVAAGYTDDVLEWIPLEDLTAHDVHRALWRMHAAGYSATTVSEYQRFLVEVLAQAARERLIERTPLGWCDATVAIHA